MPESRFWVVVDREAHQLKSMHRTEADALDAAAKMNYNYQTDAYAAEPWRDNESEDVK